MHINKYIINQSHIYLRTKHATCVVIPLVYVFIMHSPIKTELKVIGERVKNELNMFILKIIHALVGDAWPGKSGASRFFKLYNFELYVPDIKKYLGSFVYK